MLKPTISSGCPLKSDDTLLMTPGVSILGNNNNKKKNVRQKLYKTIRKWDLFHFLTLLWTTKNSFPKQQSMQVHVLITYYLTKNNHNLAIIKSRIQENRV